VACGKTSKKAALALLMRSSLSIAATALTMPSSICVLNCRSRRTVSRLRRSCRKRLCTSQLVAPATSNPVITASTVVM
jgi:hypothetical protein